MLRTAAIVFAVSVALLTRGEAMADDPVGLETSAICAPSSAGCGHTSGESRAYNPVMVAPMYAKANSFTVALVDERSPAGTEYKVTVLDPHAGAPPVHSDWSPSHCRVLGDLGHHGWRIFEVAARSPSGHQPKPDQYWYWHWGPDSWETTPADDPWLKDRVDEAVSIYSLTDEARDMLASLPFKIHPNEPGYAAYWGPNRGIGLGLATHPWTFLHEAMHAFWENWDGFPLPCDQMNVWTFRRDLTSFLLQFLLYERPGRLNPLETDRRYYAWNAADFGHYPDSDYVEVEGESAWDLVFRTHRSEDHWGAAIWTLYYHIAETNSPMSVLGNPHLLPPSLARYFEGFIDPDSRVYSTTSWIDRLTHFESLASEDRRLMEQTDRMLLRLYALGYEPVYPAERSVRMPEPLRTQVRNADRQALADYFNTLELMGCNADCRPWWDVDPRFWEHYSITNLVRFQIYADEISRDTGITLEQPNWTDMHHAFTALLSCEIDTDEKRVVIDSLPNITDDQRAALHQVLIIRDTSDWLCQLSYSARDGTGRDYGAEPYGIQGGSKGTETERCHGIQTTPPSDLSKPPCQ